MVFPHDDPDIFAAFFDLLYLGTYKFPKLHDGFVEDQHTEVIKLFCLTEKFDCPELKKCLIRAIIKYGRDKGSPPNVHEVAMLYDGTTSDCRLRMLYVQWWVGIIHEDFFSNPNIQKAIKNRPEMAMDIITELTRFAADPGDYLDPLQLEPSTFFDQGTHKQ